MSRRGFTLIEIVIVVVIIGVLVGLAAPSYERYRKYSYTRSCYAQQKTIAAAIQNFNLDRNDKRNDLPDILPVLVSAGYLRVVPSDPGAGIGSSANYLPTSVGFSITCRQHGPVR